MLNNYRSFKNGTTKLYHYKPNGRAMTTLIDTEDLELLIKLDVRWSIIKHNKSGVHRVVGRIDGKLTYLSRFLMNCPDNLVVDHINRDTLDNRKSNLRCVTQLVNARNTDRCLTQYIHHDERLDLYRIYVGDLTSRQDYYGTYPTHIAARSKVKEVRAKLSDQQLPSK